MSRHLIVCPAHPNLKFDELQPDNCQSELNADVYNINKKLLLLQKIKENIENGLDITQDFEMEADEKNEEDDSLSIASMASVTSEKTKKRKLEFNTGCDLCAEYFKRAKF